MRAIFEVGIGMEIGMNMRGGVLGRGGSLLFRREF